MRKHPRVLVTAGPTREKIDPVRFISNFSTGLIGYEIARAARRKGSEVALISGPTNLIPPKGIRFIRVETAEEMAGAVRRNFRKTDCVFMSSAVCDWRPAKISRTKIKKIGTAKNLKLTKNPDILFDLGKRKKRRVLVGFALESNDLYKNAKKKFSEKHLDIIAANKITKKKNPFGKGLRDVLVINGTGRNTWLRHATKKRIAAHLVNKAEKLWQKKVSPGPSFEGRGSQY